MPKLQIGYRKGGDSKEFVHIERGPDPKAQVKPKLGRPPKE